MEYKGSYGKTVSVKTDKDLDGNKIDQHINYVITFYIDSGASVVGIYPLDEEVTGYNKTDILSFQPIKHEVFTDDLIEVKEV